MAYPINPPASYYMLRKDLRDPIYSDGGLVESHKFWFWEPARIARDPSDWLMGPYRTRKLARAALDRFNQTMGDGEPIRTWAI